MDVSPIKLDLKRDARLRIEWNDGRETTATVGLLRQLCPCAMCKIARDGVDPHQLMRRATPEEMEAMGEAPPKPKKRSMKLNVVPSSLAADERPVTVDKAEMIGNYALKLFFTDGHSSGIYTWPSLREISGEPTGQPSPG